MAHNEKRHVLVRALNTVLVSILRFYQRAISPHIPPTCRYTPTCSQYAVEALQKFGPLKGTYRAVMRVLRCTPFHKGGYDPVR